MKHCDVYIDDVSSPTALRLFLTYARSPAHGMTQHGSKPELYADLNGVRVRVVMASRFGDVGVTTNLEKEYGYERRVWLEELKNFGDVP